jgi:hypothetical protein
MPSQNRKPIPKIPPTTKKELLAAIRQMEAELAAGEHSNACCAKVVWNNPWQLKYADPFGGGTVIRVNLNNQTDAGRFEEAAAILKHRHPNVDWIIA